MPEINTSLDRHTAEVLRLLLRCRAILKDPQKRNTLQHNVVERNKFLKLAHQSQSLVSQLADKAPDSDGLASAQIDTLPTDFQAMRDQPPVVQCQLLLRGIIQDGRQYPWLIEHDLFGTFATAATDPTYKREQSLTLSPEVTESEASDAPPPTLLAAGPEKPIPSRRYHQEALDTLFKKQNDLFTTGDGTNLRQRRYATPTTETDQTERLLTHHRQVQDELTGDLVRMAETLKGNTLMFGDLLTKDEKVLQEAQEVITGNVTHLQTQDTRLGRYSQRSWGTTWLTWGVILFVSITFMLMYFVVRLFPKV
ncbi:hypothetical protein H4R34_000436 [Dimargaris verticillata]|uniref:Vesicle transport protein USE1 n=1 Tax=Dimargaris verticillata TaxID=2761393 RepID=A0A9W8B6Q7_9FUNG|nr:hypothetical protein H4R34_000436 [Dimargaris verticillata]